MAESILMPRQGNTVESCIILSWKKEIGDTVSNGEVLCEVETDKATFEVESTAEGTVLARFFEEGDDVPVLTPIAAVGAEGEDVSGLAPEVGGASEAPAPETKREQQLPGPQPGTADVMQATAAGSGDRLAVSPRARRLAEQSGIDPSLLAGTGTGPHGRIIERDVQAALASGQPLTPAAAASRRETGATAPASGSGIGGRVRLQDLAPSGGAATTTGTSMTDLEFPGAFETVPVAGVRKVIAKRMHASLAETAQLTLHSSADARQIMRYRKLLKQSDVDEGLRSITINDIVLFAAVRTIAEFPDMNAHFLGDEIRKFDHVHAGFAVDTERGLMVPVIRYADIMTLKQLSAETNRLAAACQSGKVEPDELAGGTFTVTNLGALGVEMFTPVLNPPEVAILGVCSIEPKPVATDDGYDFVPHIGLSLTFDHRSVDGAPAAWFLKRLCERIASFELVLAG